MGVINRAVLAQPRAPFQRVWRHGGLSTSTVGIASAQGVFTGSTTMSWFAGVSVDGTTRAGNAGSLQCHGFSVTTAIGNGWFVEIFRLGNVTQFRLRITDGGAVARTTGYNTITPEIEIARIGFTFDGANIQCYLNGAVAGAATPCVGYTVAPGTARFATLHSQISFISMSAMGMAWIMGSDTTALGAAAITAWDAQVVAAIAGGQYMPSFTGVEHYWDARDGTPAGVIDDRIGAVDLGNTGNVDSFVYSAVQGIT